MIILYIVLTVTINLCSVNSVYSLVFASINVTEKMEGADLLDNIVTNPPSEPLYVAYNDFEVNYGTILTPIVVKDEPIVKWKAEPNTYYTLYLTNRDAETSSGIPKTLEWRNWLVVNIPEDNLSKGQVIIEYIGAGPELKTTEKLHRYVFLLYKQQYKIDCLEVHLDKTTTFLRQPYFPIRMIAMKYDLGQPVAGNYFRAKYDDNVPRLYNSLKDL